MHHTAGSSATHVSGRYFRANAGDDRWKATLVGAVFSLRNAVVSAHVSSVLVPPHAMLLRDITHTAWSASVPCFAACSAKPQVWPTQAHDDKNTLEDLVTA
eukprot:2797889-Rhodomonas_salina.2